MTRDDKADDRKPEEMTDDPQSGAQEERSDSTWVSNPRSTAR
jgi:hypothetical protein